MCIRDRGNAGITMGTMANQDLSWEESKTFDIGTDISFFNNRLNFIFDISIVPQIIC